MEPATSTWMTRSWRSAAGRLVYKRSMRLKGVAPGVVELGELGDGVVEDGLENLSNRVRTGNFIAGGCVKPPVVTVDEVPIAAHEHNGLGVQLDVHGNSDKDVLLGAVGPERVHVDVDEHEGVGRAREEKCKAAAGGEDLLGDGVGAVDDGGVDTGHDATCAGRAGIRVVLEEGAEVVVGGG